jgi:hypothetical protein
MTSRFTALSASLACFVSFSGRTLRRQPDSELHKEARRRPWTEGRLASSSRGERNEELLSRQEKIRERKNNTKVVVSG